MNVVQLDRSRIAGTVPPLVRSGQLVINLVDRRLYSYDGSQVVHIDATINVGMLPPDNPIKGTCWLDLNVPVLKVWDDVGGAWVDCLASLTAVAVSYDPTTSGIAATNEQEATDLLVAWNQTQDASINNHTTSLANLNTALATTNANVTTNTTAISQVASDLILEQANINQNAADIGLLTTQLAVVESNLLALSARVDQHDNDILALQFATGGSSTDISALLARLDALELQTADLQANKASKLGDTIIGDYDFEQNKVLDAILDEGYY